jgi:GH24 family phage-related lysozyme (muramidase)
MDSSLLDLVRSISDINNAVLFAKQKEAIVKPMYEAAPADALAVNQDAISAKASQGMDAGNVIPKYNSDKYDMVTKYPMKYNVKVHEPGKDLKPVYKFDFTFTGTPRNLKYGDLLRELIETEGFSATHYKDPVRGMNIGFGFQGEKVKTISVEKAYDTLQTRLEDMDKLLPKRFEWYNSLDDSSKQAVMLATYKMGANKFAEFEDTIGALKSGNKEEVTKHIKNSDWYRDQSPASVDAFIKLLNR